MRDERLTLVFIDYIVVDFVIRRVLGASGDREYTNIHSLHVQGTGALTTGYCCDYCHSQALPEAMGYAVLAPIEDGFLRNQLHTICSAACIMGEYIVREVHSKGAHIVGGKRRHRLWRLTVLQRAENRQHANTWDKMHRATFGQRRHLETLHGLDRIRTRILDVTCRKPLLPS